MKFRRGRQDRIEVFRRLGKLLTHSLRKDVAGNLYVIGNDVLRARQ
jgi:hypothetical protein